MLSSYGKSHWITILIVGGAAVAFCAWRGFAASHGWWAVGAAALLLALSLLSFYRDPLRQTPTQKGIVVAPADGRITSVHRIEHFEPLGGPATCIRIFLSVADVHVNRSACHGLVASLTHKPGQYMNALNPKSAEVNESLLMVLVHPVKRKPVAAIRQVSGALARTIVCDAKVGQTLQRGQRYGMIKLGSTTELYLPDTMRPEVLVRQGQKKIRGGETPLARVSPTLGNEIDDPSPADASTSASAQG
ncbi:MAG: phosphatidylserine decarboxylase [Planctomycetota bacterium]|nr:phosphatidylserine decarboxylase [Planctomycetota bacterium]